MATTTNTTKKYELTILVDEVAPQETIDELTEKIKGYGKITSTEDWGGEASGIPNPQPRKGTLSILYPRTRERRAG